jgi:hypothetical protein
MSGSDDRQLRTETERVRFHYRPPGLAILGHLSNVAQKSGTPNDNQHPTLGKPGGGGG